jgi:dihydroorotate dehydrogenase (fumarate)
MNLTTRYMGFALKNPIIASASPLNSDVGNIRELEDAGAAAVVLPSIFEEQIEAEADRYETLLAHSAESFAEASSYFPAAGVAHTGAGAYLDLIHRATAAVEIPVIASLNGATDQGWIAYAKEMEQAGARAIELNIYMIPTDLGMSGRDVEQRYLDIVRAVRAEVTIPIAVKLGPYFSAMGAMAKELEAAGADALVLFNRFYQPDIDLAELRLLKDLKLSGHNEIRLPLLWIAVLAGNLRASIAASTGVETAEQVLKYLLVGADAVMTTSAILRHGTGHVGTLLSDLRAWMQARDVGSLDRIRGAMSQKKMGPSDPYARANYIEIIERYQVDRR